jgi:hypothetical protein
MEGTAIDSRQPTSAASSNGWQAMEQQGGTMNNGATEQQEQADSKNRNSQANIIRQTEQLETARQQTTGERSNGTSEQ